jgi:hypothetical protein
MQEGKCDCSKRICDCPRGHSSALDQITKEKNTVTKATVCVAIEKKANATTTPSQRKLQYEIRCVKLRLFLVDWHRSANGEQKAIIHQFLHNAMAIDETAMDNNFTGTINRLKFSEPWLVKFVLCLNYLKKKGSMKIGQKCANLPNL